MHGILEQSFKSSQDVVEDINEEDLDDDDSFPDSAESDI